MENDYKKYLIPSVVSTLGNMELRAKFIVQGFMAGLHKSPYHGFSVEFAEHRQYSQGDDIRYLDWKIYGRTERFYVKQFEEETNLKSYIVLDVSKSMDYASPDLKENKRGKKKPVQNSGKAISKIEYSKYLAASLAYLMQMQRDAVSLVTYDTQIRKYFPPHSTKSHLKLILSELHSLKLTGKTASEESLNAVAEIIKKRGLVIVISDLLDNQDSVLNALKHFRYNKNEVILFQILTPFEINFIENKSAILEDMETGATLYAQSDLMGEAYRTAMKRFIEKYKTECRKNNIDYILLNTSMPFDEALLKYLDKRKRTV
ncbi:MAG TPA: DUF58 domain-containing protein [Ignavibacteria bacterium]|nr:DUF58 domain-containing protein [Ignavibacteria bacterium]